MDGWKIYCFCLCLLFSFVSIFSINNKHIDESNMLFRFGIMINCFSLVAHSPTLCIHRKDQANRRSVKNFNLKPVIYVHLSKTAKKKLFFWSRERRRKECICWVISSNKLMILVLFSCLFHFMCPSSSQFQLSNIFLYTEVWIEIVGLWNHGYWIKLKISIQVAQVMFEWIKAEDFMTNWFIWCVNVLVMKHFDTMGIKQIWKVLKVFCLILARTMIIALFVLLNRDYLVFNEN